MNVISSREKKKGVSKKNKIVFQIKRCTKVVSHQPDAWGDQRWRGRQHEGHRLQRIRLCTYRIRCQQPVRRFHLPWLNCKKKDSQVSHPPFSLCCSRVTSLTSCSLVVVHGISRWVELESSIPTEPDKKWCCILLPYKDIVRFWAALRLPALWRSAREQQERNIRHCQTRRPETTPSGSLRLSFTPRPPPIVAQYPESLWFIITA